MFLLSNPRKLLIIFLLCRVLSLRSELVNAGLRQSGRSVYFLFKSYVDGQPSIKAPIAGPLLSPQVEILNI